MLLRGTTQKFSYQRIQRQKMALPLLLSLALGRRVNNCLVVDPDRLVLEWELQPLQLTAGPR